MSVSLTPQQDAAVKQFRAWFEEVRGTTYDVAPFYCQQGFAGTGKTTILPFFIEAIGLDPKMDVTFVAPTGKAAKIMTNKLRAQGLDVQAITIHKAMYRPKGMKFYAIEAQIKDIVQALGETPPQERGELQKTLKLLQRDLDRAYDSSAPSFMLEASSPAMRKPVQLIVCDEASMVGEGMAGDMLSFGTPVLAIGDPGQLQPVGDKPGFFVRPPDNILTEIHRQALDNPIIWASKLIREGKDLPMGSHGGGLLRVLTKRTDDVTFDMDRDKQIIVGMNDLRHRITRKCRDLIGLNAKGPTVDEMMLIIKNSRKYPNLVNGTMIRVTESAGDLNPGDIHCPVCVEDEDGFKYKLNVIQAHLEENYLGKGEWTASKRAVRHAMEREEYHHIDWAYAITCHKSQGSQWKDVVVHDQSSVFRDQSAQWLYTAVTRAAETLTVVQF